ncbi:MAG: BamA/TamA family outer membrane protein [Deltaproteobacteria bacterium]|nr:BamA/TamA family outer membrane protein [Deltaproteobacteria bacterium]
MLSTAPSPTDPAHTAVTYTVSEHGDVRIGKVVVRGNFRTRTKVILDELGFEEGAPLTGALYAAGPRRLRAMNLFSAVNVELLDFEQVDSDRVNVVVRVEERYDERAQVDFEGGYTQVNNVFLKVTPTLPNLWGTGLWLQGAATLGYSYQAIEGSLRVPRWQARKFLPLRPDLEVSAYLRNQTTPRFGGLVTKGFSVALSRVWQRPHTAGVDARSIATTLRYDFRLRNRYEDTLRVAGPASDETQAPVSTTTGAVGVNLVWDQRLDHNGNLNPLAPERGYRLDAGVAFASPYLLGQDTFVKVSGGAQAVLTANDRLQFHLDVRLDEGFPLGGAVLLPEVERFFAGGDTTVRGFAEDRLATELVLSAVPPFGNVQQIRVVPSGGNIRALGSIDAQVRVWKVGQFPIASAVFLDAGLVTNTWTAVRGNDIRPSVGVSLVRFVSPFGAISLDYAVPLTPRLVADNPTGFLSFSVALRN